MVEILLQIEESVKEDRRHLAQFQVLQVYIVGLRGANHIQHLQQNCLHQDLNIKLHYSCCIASSPPLCS